MWLRRAFFRWLVPAAFVLPLWLLIGWIAFNASGWVLIWVLLIAMPSVLVGQLILTLLVRARGTVRHSGVVSWGDAAGFGLWHGLTIAVGFYPEAAFWPLLIGAVLAFLGLFWFLLGQLFREAGGRPVLRRTPGGIAYIPPEQPTARTAGPAEVIVVTEKPAPPAP